MQALPLPTHVHIHDAAQTVELHWDDGHRSTYPWWYLRGLCPCAACQGHQVGLTFIPSDAAQLTRLDEVGNYAFNIVWDGDHTTGIYSFEGLRSMCPCAVCWRRDRLGHPALVLPPDKQALLIAALTSPSTPFSTPPSTPPLANVAKGA